MKKSSVLLSVLLLMSTTVVAACGGAKQETKPAPAPAPAADKKAEAPAPAAGDGSLDRVKKAGKILFGVDSTYPPMEFIDKDGKTIIGFDVDLAKAMAAKMGLQAEFQTFDFDGLIPGLNAKRMDGIISSMNITEERSKQVNFIEYAKMSQIFVSKKGVTVKTEKDLAGKTVIVQAETTSQEYVDKLKKDSIKDIKEIRTFKAATDVFLELKNGRGDVIIIDEPVGRYYAKLDAATFTVTGQAMSPEPVGIAIRKEDKSLQEALTKALADVKADGTYKKISEQWFGGELGK